MGIRSFARRIRARVQYDGTEYSGFQKQKNVRTIQEVLEKSLGRLLSHNVTVQGAGRTDAGVHARGQVIAFNTNSSIPAEKIPKSLAVFLPRDVLVDWAEDVSLDFDPTRDAISKTYCYRIWRSQRPCIMLHRYVLWYPGYLDFDLISKETRMLLGRRDFRNFRASGSSAKTTVREVFEARWVRKDVENQKDALWEFWITADGFLYKMVRLIVGTLIDVGRGYLPEGTVREALEGDGTSGTIKIGRCVPGRGLCLEKVQFS